MRMSTVQLILTVVLVVTIDFLTCKGGASACPFNPCTTLPGLCPGMTCVLDAGCNMDCVCDETSTAESCLEPTTGSPNDEVGENVTFTTPKVGSCPDGVICVHGFCEIQIGPGSVCVCEKGWVGAACNETEHVCSLSCPSGTRCVFFGSGGPAICLPVPDTKTTPSPVTSLPRERNVCNKSHYERPLASEHECGLPCEYGVCRNVNGSISCDCDPGSHGQVCQNECCLDCGGRGVCYYDSARKEPLCNCWLNYTGAHCEEIRTLAAPVVMTKSDTWYLWVAGVSVTVLVLLLALMVILPYVMWRHRVLLVMKIVHYFQNYEDDDDRQWDAFVSYKSNTADEQFVARTLFPKLEQEMGFRLHVHFRDFVPGDTIADNIVRAILGSRRTILIVSPGYASSEWTKFEYQVAQQEMLKRKHRIIPIMLDDIVEKKDSLDPNLKAILGSVTYLEWPRCGSQKKLDKFWKRLELSLPKKRTSSLESDSGVDNKGYDTIRPDAIDISVVSEKQDRMTPYIIDDIDYATINEAKMNKRNLELNDKNDNEYEKDVELLSIIDRNNDTMNARNDRKGGIDELNNVLNKKLDNEHAKSEHYIEILNGGKITADV